MRAALAPGDARSMSIANRHHVDGVAVGVLSTLDVAGIVGWGLA